MGLFSSSTHSFSTLAGIPSGPGAECVGIVFIAAAMSSSSNCMSSKHLGPGSSNSSSILAVFIGSLNTASN